MSIYQLANNNSFLGFTDNRTALQAGKIEKCLSKAFRYNGVVMERRDKMLQDLRNGKEPKIAEETVNGKTKKSYRVYSTIKDGEFAGTRVFSEITKTEYDFCMYLIKNDLVSEKRVNAYIEEEKQRKEEKEVAERQAEEAAREEEEKQAAELAEFETWAKSMAEMYSGTSNASTMEKIFIDKLGEFKNPIGAFKLLVYIDNIDSHPLCRKKLKERLYTGNKASRKTFECVTGLKLPKSNKETRSFIDNLHKADYQEMNDYKVKNAKEDKVNKELDTNKQEFYILEGTTENGEKKATYKKVLGERIVKRGFECFIREMPDGRFAVSSTECGVKLATGNTKAEAIKELKKVISRVGDTKIREKIKEFVTVFGASPAYNIA